MQTNAHGIPVDIAPALECFPLREALLAYTGACVKQSSPALLADLLATIAKPDLYDLPGLSTLVSNPTTTKETLRESQTQWLNRLALGDELWVKYTTGTTGPPVPIPQSRLFQYDQLFLAPLRAARYRAPNLEPDATVLALTDNPDCDTVIWPNPWGGLVCQYYLGDDPAAADGLSRTVAELEPDLITAKPSLAKQLAALSSRGELLVPCPVLVSGAEISRAAKKAYEQALGVPVIEAFGLTETGLIASDCDCGAGLAIDRDVAIEVLDAEDRAVTDGQFGHLVVTSLRNIVLPIVRYATGDTITLGVAPRCDRGLHIQAIGGRVLPPFVSREGQLVPAARFHALFTHFPIVEFQMVQTRAGELDVVAEAHEGEPVDCDAMAEWIRNRSALTMRVRVRLAAIQTKGKFRRYVSMLDS